MYNYVTFSSQTSFIWYFLLVYCFSSNAYFTKEQHRIVFADNTVYMPVFDNLKQRKTFPAIRIHQIRLICNLKPVVLSINTSETFKKRECRIHFIPRDSSEFVSCKSDRVKYLGRRNKMTRVKATQHNQHHKQHTEQSAKAGSKY